MYRKLSIEEMIIYLDLAFRVSNLFFSANSLIASGSNDPNYEAHLKMVTSGATVEPADKKDLNFSFISGSEAPSNTRFSSVLEVGNNQDKKEDEYEPGLPVFGGGQAQSETDNTQSGTKESRAQRPIRHAASF